MLRLHRKRRNSPIPPDDILRKILTPEQIEAIEQVREVRPEWKLAFVRRPLFHEPVVVFKDTHTEKILTLSKKGHFDLTPRIEVREC
jgi:hypothetical protein